MKLKAIPYIKFQEVFVSIVSIKLLVLGYLENTLP